MAKKKKKKAARKARRKPAKDLTATTGKVRGARGGATFRPEADDEVLVAFQSGTPRAGVVVGTLWNGSDKPPASR
jgi:hypothetical protein